MRTMAAILFCCLLLCGCGRIDNPALEKTDSVFPAEGLHPNSNSLPVSNSEALRVYELPEANIQAFYCMDEDLIFACSNQDSVVLTKLSGKRLIPNASISTNLKPDSVQQAIHVFQNHLTCYNPATHQYTMWDSQLREELQVTLSEKNITSVIPSSDCKTLYYAAPGSICEYNVSSGFRRILKEIDADTPELEGPFHSGSLLCKYDDPHGQVSSVFLSAENGATEYAIPYSLQAEESKNTLYLSYYVTPEDIILFGSDLDHLQELRPLPNSRFLAFLPESDQAILERKDNSETVLDLYGLSDGKRKSCISLGDSGSVSCICSDSKGIIYCTLSDKPDLLIRWDPNNSTVIDWKYYCVPYFTDETPDWETLEQCRLSAQKIGSKYSIQILLCEDATKIQPWDYRLHSEYRSYLFFRALDQMDEQFRHFPDGFLKTLSEESGGITICLVRSITGTDESSGFEIAQGLQFRKNNRSYVALALCRDLEYNFYHELAHLIDTKVISNCNAFDNWNDMNPEGFHYFYDSPLWQTQTGSPYLQGETRAFIDAYSMSYPTEDRARIMEYAMTANNEAYFDSPIMQEKLRQLCIGIRRAFGLSKSSENFLWEQYLWNSISYRSM